MKKLKWTPAPWYACGKGNCQCHTVSCSDHPIATIEHGEWGDIYPAIRLQKGTGSIEGKYEVYQEKISYGDIDPEESHANLLLIAAAPDLYLSSNPVDLLMIATIIMDKYPVEAQKLREIANKQSEALDKADGLIEDKSQLQLEFEVD